ncbi:RtcB family protein [Janthinobacterium sp. JC611]|uniref:RtcB family protein n=1 Tax=Janthinobacterium sp. JC611 TaxID=2816201 RepID=UPI003342C253
MFPLSRLQKALRRQGIAVAYADGIYTLSNPHAQASVLLPHNFPLEEKAVRQLMAFAAVAVPGQDGHVCKACATPDFHPGSIAPVGSIVATSPDMVIPAIPGTDIACGMCLITTGLTLAQFEARKPQLLAKLKHVLLEDGRNVPLRSKAFAALFDVGPEAFIDSLHKDGICGLWPRVDKARLLRELDDCIALRELGGGLRHAPEALVGTRDVIRDPSLGTTGSGNHFVEIQLVDAVMDRHAAYRHGLVPGEVVVMRRSIRRQAMRAMRPTVGGDEMAFQCVTLREERRVEEAPMAYKKIGPVIAAQEEAGLLQSVARLKPLLTFKA